MQRQIKTTHLIALIVVLGPALSLAVDPVGYWAFDEGSGTTAADSSGNGNDGTIQGASWDVGKYGNALRFDGADDYVEVPSSPNLEIDGPVTMAAWINWIDSGDGWQTVMSKGPFSGPGENYAVFVNLAGRYFHFALAADGGRVTHNSPNDSVVPNEWLHVGCTADGSVARIYINGEMVMEAAQTGGLVPAALPLRIGHREGSSHYWNGMIDDVLVYDNALTLGEIQNVMQGISRELASAPLPEDALIDVLRDVVLGWAPGEFAVAHDVYLGTVFDDVNNASAANDPGVRVSQGQTDTSYDAGILDFGQTYFWRVDEVNGAPDRTVFKGKVWSFTVEPFSIPVETITATASSSNAANMGPENTINGVGLNELDQHSVEPTEMWLSGMGDPTPSVQYEFDKPYKLHEMWVWNSNQLVEAFVGIGAKDVMVEYSLDGAAWMILADASQFAQASGDPSYTANTVVDFGGAMAQYVRITISAGYGMLPQYGLSEVRFYYVPTFAREPQPVDGEIVAGANAVLSWRAGREAASHEVHLGTDAADLPLVGTSDDNSYDTGALDFDTTYYWQIVEVNAAETPTAHAGPIWSFTTPPFAVVDNFDTYDDDCERIFFAWADGLGHNGGTDIDDCAVAPSNGNGGGSIVGHSMAPFAEQGIVYAGTQSLPFNYDNAFGPSEATLTLAPQDWTASGIQSLSLFVFGAADNSGQLYLKINNTKVVGAPDITQPGWQPWLIDLATVGGSLQNVTSLTIGVDGANAAGMLYIDEIRLYPQAIELVTPAAPDDASLMVHYPLDGNVLDSSGQGRDGEAVGAPTYVGGADGQAIQLNGVDEYINLVLDVPENGCAVSFWFNTSNPDSGLFAVVQDPLGGGGHDRHIYLVNGNIGIRLWSSEILTTAGLNAADGQWHHIAYTYGDAIGGQEVYLDGILVARGNKTSSDFDWQERVHFGFSNDGANNYLEGSLDDARIYSRTLTPTEIAWLAGKSDPMPKPF